MSKKIIFDPRKNLTAIVVFKLFLSWKQTDSLDYFNILLNIRGGKIKEIKSENGAFFL